MNLAEQIDALRRHMISISDMESETISLLGQEISRADSETISSLRSIVSNHEYNRSQIASMLRTLAARIGHAPGPAVIDGGALTDQAAPMTHVQYQGVEHRRPSLSQLDTERLVRDLERTKAA